MKPQIPSDDTKLQQILNDTMTESCLYNNCRWGINCIPCALDRIKEWNNIQISLVISEYKTEISELIRKGELLCCQNGTILMENHDLKVRINELETQLKGAKNK